VYNRIDSLPLTVVIVMSEDVLPHAAFDIVHRKVAVVPIVKPVTPEVGKLD
jgi:hypothetical protein